MRRIQRLKTYLVLQSLVSSDEVEVLLVQARVQVDEQNQTSARNAVAVRGGLDQQLVKQITKTAHQTFTVRRTQSYKTKKEL